MMELCNRKSYVRVAFMLNMLASLNKVLNIYDRKDSILPPSMSLASNSDCLQSLYPRPCTWVISSVSKSTTAMALFSYKKIM